ncbi:MAG: putative Ig domain-containing protein [Acidobacteria bacterium]|nr:putative Ig domain-containing protein [Acidobacteriota bacterium]
MGGKFTILEITVDNGQLISFAADFTQYDEMALASWNYGSIRYNSSIPLNTLPPEPIKPFSIACTESMGPVLIILPYSYSSTCFASGGAGPYTWSVNNLPPGMETVISYYDEHNSMSISGNPASIGLFNYTVTATDSYGNMASQNFSGTTTRPDCQPSGLNNAIPQTHYFGPSGGSSYVGFSFTSKGCPWSLTADIPRVTFSPASGQTRGFDRWENVSVKAAENKGSTPLVGNIFLSEAGKVVRAYPIVVNSNSCSYTVNPASGQFGPQGGSGTLTVTASPDSCRSFIANYSSWLTATDGVYYYEIPPNAGAARSGAFEFGRDSIEAVASFAWEQEAGDGSLLMNCYKPGPGKIGSTVAICVAAGGTPPYSWNIIDGTVPGDEMEISTDGSSVRLGDPVESGSYVFTIQVTDSASQSFGIATYTVAGTVQPRPSYFKCSAKAGPTRTATTYSTICAPYDGTPPYRWLVSEGELPPGLGLTLLDNDLALISGSPSSAGDYSYTLQLIDSSEPDPVIAEQVFEGTIAQTGAEPAPFTLACAVSSASFLLGIPIEPIGCSVSGGTQPYTWSLHTGVLPTGLTLDDTTGSAIIIAGVPTEASYNGSFDVNLKATDSSSTPLSRIKSLDLGVYHEFDFSCYPAAGQVGQFYFASCKGTYITNLWGLWISAGQLPPGLILTSKGIAGTPTSPGMYAFEISLQNGQYPAPSHFYEIAIGSVAVPITIATHPAGRSFTVDGTGYTTSQTFSWLSGSSHTISVATQQASGGTRYVFANWSDGGASSHTITVPSGAATYTANFATQYRLTTAASPSGGGSISADPVSTDGYYDSGSSVQLTAAASSGYTFAGWGGALSGTANQQILTMSAPQSVTATFRSGSASRPRFVPKLPARPKTRRDGRLKLDRTRAIAD